MRPLLRFAAVLLAAAFVLAGALPSLAGDAVRPRPLRVIASIKPLHSLIAGIMSGHGGPVLLIPAGVSPYVASVHANEAYLLSGADIVFWIGEPLEAGLTLPLTHLRSARVVDLVRIGGLVRYKTRSGYWEPGTAGPDAEAVAREIDLVPSLGWFAASGAPLPDAANYYVDPPPDPTPPPEPDPAEAALDLAGVDGHIWLDPLNAQLMVDRIVEVLSEADIDNAPDYRRNGESVKNRLKLLDADMETMLAPARGKPFLVVSDAYQYLEVRYALAGSGSVKLMPDRPPAPDRLAQVHAKIAARQAQCVFGDPSVPSRITEAAVEGTASRVGELDPLGVGIPDGIDLYFMMMRRLAKQLKECLAG
jgi:zinc transport system substrate-binding protein